MKHLKVFLFILIIGATSCEKLELKNDLEGKWEVLGSSGGYTGGGTALNYTHVEFQKKNYTVSNDLEVIEEGSYSLSKIEESGYAPMVWRVTYTVELNNDSSLRFGSNFEMGIFFEGSDTLTLSELNISDGYQYHFKREKKSTKR